MSMDSTRLRNTKIRCNHTVESRNTRFEFGLRLIAKKILYDYFLRFEDMI